MQRAAIIVAFLAAVALVCGAVWRMAYVAALEPLERRAEADLRLAADRLTADLQRYKELAVLLADHPAVLGLIGGTAGREEAQALLRGRADLTGSRDILVLDAAGRVVASAEGRPGQGAELADVVARALDGALGTGHGVQSGSESRVFRFAAPVFAEGGPARGAVVVVAGVDQVESALRGARPAMFFTDESGRIFISSRSELVFRPRDGFVDHDRARLGEFELWRVRGGPYLPDRALHLSLPLPVLELEGEVLVDIAPARQVALLQAAIAGGLCLGFGTLLVLAALRRRALARINRQLEARVAQRTAELTALNADLSHEVEVRRAAEAQLTRAQAELVQAAKLSALGQMSAGLSHELNQPLMAIRTFAENAQGYLAQGRTEVAASNLARIGDLSRRMGRIIRNLRAFARQESEPLTDVDVGAVVAQVLEMAEARARQAEVEILWTPPPLPVRVRAGEVRLSQVLLNLVTNAIDAMEGAPRRRVEIALAPEGARVRVSVRDTGPGLAEPERVFDPFYTTKEVGEAEGMGLGLSISYGLVQSFGGDIRGRNHADGGAVFTVELERAAERVAA